MKTLIPVLFLLSACSVTQENVPPDTAATLDELQAFEAKAEADIEAGKAALSAALGTLDAKDDAKAAQAIQEAEGRLRLAREGLAELERRVLTERAGPIVGAIATAAGPIGATLYPAIMGLVPLLGRRGRRHYANAMKNLAPWVPDANGEKGIAPGDAALDILRALGVLHSEPVDKTPPAA